MFLEPRIPPNTGNAIRMVSGTGAVLHLVEPLGFDLAEAKLRRAGLDYHDLAQVVVHPDLDDALARLPGVDEAELRTGLADMRRLPELPDAGFGYVAHKSTAVR